MTYPSGTVLIMDTMKCVNCGFENNDLAVYCEKCGKGVATKGASYRVSADTQTSRRSRIASNATRNTAIWIIIGIVLFVIGIISVLASMGSILGSALDVGDDPFGSVGDMLGGFGKMVLGAIMIAIGGTMVFVGFVYAFIKAAG